MSSPTSPGGQQQSNDAQGTDQSLSRKSYRRKYRKIMVTFEERMREATTLFKEEQRMSDVSQRLSEQIDQLMLLLLELNSYPQVPSPMRYDLQAPGISTKPALDSDKDMDVEEGHEALHKARHRLRLGEISKVDYQELEEQLLEMPAFRPLKSYNSLLKTTALPVSSVDLALDGANPPPCGFLTIKQEDLYNKSLDDHINGDTTNPRSHVVNNLGNPNAEKTIEREREMQLRNPVSVYNWLRKHQPQVFLQDHEAGTEKPPKATASRISKRGAGGKDPGAKQEQDLYDEDGIAAETTAPSRGKRKRDDDGGYRPKGGSSRSSKRKKDDNTPAMKRGGKKMSLDARS